MAFPGLALALHLPVFDLVGKETSSFSPGALRMLSLVTQGHGDGLLERLVPSSEVGLFWLPRSRSSQLGTADVLGQVFLWCGNCP